MKTYHWCWILALLSLFPNSLYNQISELTPDVNGGTHLLSGKRITYHWIYIDENGQTIPYSLFIDFDTPMDSMQKAYLTKFHREINFAYFISDDPFKEMILVLAGKLQDLASVYSIPEAELALSFVQALPYQTNMGIYQRYAAETLIDAQGDCSDTAVLYAGILSAWRYDCVFLKYPGHIAIGVWVAPDIEKGIFYTHRDRRFYYAETTGPGSKIGGQLPYGCYQADIEEVFFD